MTLLSGPPLGSLQVMARPHACGYVWHTCRIQVVDKAAKDDAVRDEAVTRRRLVNIEQGGVNEPLLQPHPNLFRLPRRRPWRTPSIPYSNSSTLPCSAYHNTINRILAMSAARMSPSFSGRICFWCLSSPFARFSSSRGSMLAFRTPTRGDTAISYVRVSCLRRHTPAR